MCPDDEICCCFHVSLRKLITFARTRKPRVASQMSECFGAGTGCGWCIPMLRKIHSVMCESPGESITAATPDEGGGKSGAEARVLAQLPDSPAHYATMRKDYIEGGRPRNEF